MAERGPGRYHKTRRWKPLPRRELGAVIEAFPELRQTLLGEFDNCRLMALFGLEGYPYTTPEQARGIIFHRFAARALSTMKMTGEVELPVEEALQILYEVMRQRDVPDDEVVLPPARERRLLRILAIKFAGENRFTSHRIMAVEKPITRTITYPNPDGGFVERTMRGTPDAVIASPEGDTSGGVPEAPGIIIPDWKTTRKAPARGPSRDDRKGDHWDDPEHVSYEGYFQQRAYGLLGLGEYPLAQWVRLREFYPLERVARYATIYRSDLPSLEEEFSMLVELLDRALGGGSRSNLWEASPGKHCSYCPKPTRCPIEEDVRLRHGGITSWAQAKRAGAEYVLAKTVGAELHEGLKAWVQHHGPIPVRAARGRYELRWKEDAGGRRQFGVHVPAASDRGPDDPALERAFLEAAERAEAAA